MSPSNVETRAIRAICHHFAGKPKYELGLDFARDIERKLPGAAVVYGYAAGDDERELPHSWIRMGNKDYDVQLIAQRIRAVRSGFDVPLDRVLSAKWNRAGELDSSYADMHPSELVDWLLPSCAACCGKNRAHTLDSGCTAPRKAEHLERRSREWQAIKNRPLMWFKGNGLCKNM